MQKQKGRSRVNEILFFVKLTENPSTVTNDTQKPSPISTPSRIPAGTQFRACNMTLKLPWYFYLLTEKSTDCYFQVWSLVISGGRYNHETYLCIFKVTD